MHGAYGTAFRQIISFLSDGNSPREHFLALHMQLKRTVSCERPHAIL